MSILNFCLKAEFEFFKYSCVPQANALRNRPELITKCQRFCAYLRKLDFLNSMREKADFKSLGEEFELSDQLKDFSNLKGINASNNQFTNLN